MARWLILGLVLLAGCRSTIDHGDETNLTSHGDAYTWLSKPNKRGSVAFTIQRAYSDRATFRLRLEDHHGVTSEVHFLPEQGGEALLLHTPGKERRGDQGAERVAGVRTSGKAVPPGADCRLAWDLGSEPPRVTLTVRGTKWPDLVLKGVTYTAVAFGIHDASADITLGD